MVLSHHSRNSMTYPTSTYTAIPIGSRKHAATEITRRQRVHDQRNNVVLVFMPVNAVTVAAPPTKKSVQLRM